MLPAHKRLQSNKEEIANGVSHGIALVGCLVATPFLLSWPLGPVMHGMLPEPPSLPEQ